MPLSFILFRCMGRAMLYPETILYLFLNRSGDTLYERNPLFHFVYDSFRHMYWGCCIRDELSTRSGLRCCT